MSLPDLTAVKDRLRIETDVEDDDLTIMLASALATIEEAVGRPIESAERTWILEAPTSNWDGMTSVYRFFLPLYPVEEESVTIEDADGEAITDFRLNPTTGLIVATESTVWDNWPYTVTATVGLDLLPAYATRVEPKLSQAFLDLCADWYQRRNPGALAEGAGGGVITQWQTLGVPERICKQLDAFRLAKAH
jgi:uncharacterized phiE125 gp8 family phage protein